MTEKKYGVSRRMKNGKQVVSRLKENGFFSIIIANILNKIVQMLTNIAITRLLGVHDYGIFGAAYNVFSFTTIFVGLGTTGAVLMYCSENRTQEEKDGIYRFGFAVGAVGELFLCIFVFMYGYGRLSNIQECTKYIYQLSLLPIFDFMYQYALVVLRSKQANSKFALLSNVNTFSYFTFGCIGALLNGVTGTILGRYISYMVCIIFAATRYNAFSFMQRACRIGTAIKKSILQFSLKNGASAALNQILNLIDIALLSALVASPEIIATYKVAALIPEGLAFIPNSVVVFIFPYFAMNRKNKEWIQKSVD